MNLYEFRVKIHDKGDVCTHSVLRTGLVSGSDEVLPYNLIQEISQ